MRHEFQAKMPEVADKIKFYIGDVRDLQSVRAAMPGVDYIFHAAALKQVPSCEFFPMEAVRTNVIGTENVLTAAIEAGVESVICLSTDKAAYPINAMGITKAIEEKVAVAKSRMSGKTKICCTRYGILSYSQTLEWKGAVEYCMTDRNGTAIEKKIDTSLNYYGTVLNAQTLEHAVPNLRNSVEKIIVIENKANYESMEYDPKVLYIFCHGYFSPKEVRFLQMLMKTAPEEIQYYHWGDMDYGGIQIFLYNDNNIIPNLMPWKMDAPSYKAALENGKGIKLSSGKQKKLEVLNAGKLEALKQCILENKMEIEQEM